MSTVPRNPASTPHPRGSISTLVGLERRCRSSAPHSLSLTSGPVHHLLGAPLSHGVHGARPGSRGAAVRWREGGPGCPRPAPLLCWAHPANAPRGPVQAAGPSSEAHPSASALRGSASSCHRPAAAPPPARAPQRLGGSGRTDGQTDHPPRSRPGWLSRLRATRAGPSGLPKTRRPCAPGRPLSTRRWLGSPLRCARVPEPSRRGPTSRAALADRPAGEEARARVTKFSARGEAAAAEGGGPSRGGRPWEEEVGS